MIKTFRGLMADDTQDTIVLHTTDGSIGYRIKKFEIMTQRPGTTAYEHVVQIWKTKQVAIDNVVDFSNQTLLGAAFIRQDADNSNITGRMAGHILFDNVVFNQDIFITLKNATPPAGGTASTAPCNFLIKLEQVKLDLNENTVATLKDIRNIEQ